MILSRENLIHINSASVIKPGAEIFELPEKVIQFGAGVLLRGLPDYFIDKANRKGIFNGRILIVKSTSNGGADEFAKQDNLYTLCVKGIEGGVSVKENTINASISRVLAASQDWAEILKAAHSPEMQVVISNTTEIGIVSSEDKITDCPPQSYPGKLLAFLHERFVAFNGSAAHGMVIVPAELISDNANKLKEILLELAIQNKLNWDFMQWLKTANYFCNTLVDRIVPGKLPAAEQGEIEAGLGYQDNLMIMAEPFRLWAIESSSKKVKEILSFAEADKGIFVVPSINKFKELKLRLLNGTHTLSCGLAILSGFNTVKEAMADADFSAYVKGLMQYEISEALINEEISHTDTVDFAANVSDRFRNPFLEHQWQAIALNFTSKMQMRNIPLIRKLYTRNTEVPAHMALGFAAYILFNKCAKNGDHYAVNVNGKVFQIQDEYAEILCNYWKNPATVVENILADERLWSIDLTRYPGFKDAVKKNVNLLKEEGTKAVMNSLRVERTV
ncbi:tagaturonate reductase [Pedobacter nototheniae]|uniref:tagaturonate reductase n=1 Tax=Pedobacter nototheniae TaxID=2488994 RepID=UPI00292EC46E|nr:tagaturonate reductase [Pedobacter nototheniae]